MINLHMISVFYVVNQNSAMVWGMAKAPDKVKSCGTLFWFWVKTSCSGHAKNKSKMAKLTSWENAWFIKWEKKSDFPFRQNINPGNIKYTTSVFDYRKPYRWRGHYLTGSVNLYHLAINKKLTYWVIFDMSPNTLATLLQAINYQVLDKINATWLRCSSEDCWQWLLSVIRILVAMK